MLRRVLFLFAIVLLLVLSWTGISGGVSQLSNARTAGQTVQTAFQFAYGVCALLGITTTFWWRRWNRPLLASWTIALAFAGGLGAYSWGGTSALIGVVSGLAAGLIGAGVAWLLRFGAAAWIRNQDS
ncbi:MAG TPA: hypothetical protein VKB45_16335 [Gemmatimonadales bacterium]|nr:hypothetical protein [Gemmatimonadales bacterium]